MKLIKISFIFIFVITFLFLLACSSATNVSGGEEFEGWVTKDDIDFYYVRTSGTASENAIEKNDNEMLKTTCIESTKLQALDNIIRKMIGETVEAQSGMLDGQATNLAVTSIRSGIIKGVNMKECAPRSGSWKNCECIYYVSGKNLKKQIQVEVQNAIR